MWGTSRTEPGVRKGDGFAGYEESSSPRVEEREGLKGCEEGAKISN